jgi:hypothetical protein
LSRAFRLLSCIQSFRSFFCTSVPVVNVIYAARIFVGVAQTVLASAAVLRYSIGWPLN